MQEVLEYIKSKKEDFSQLPFFKFLQDTSIDPRQRLAFAPCFAPFVMGFAELNKYVWREEPSNDPIQVLINQHTYEDDGHWIWFLEDLQKLGFDLPLHFSDTLRFLGGHDTQASRQAIYEIYRYTYRVSPIKKLVVIEAIEATADIFLSMTTKVAQELKIFNDREYRYFGIHHFSIDSNHSMHTPKITETIAKIEISDKNYQEYCELVNQIFDIFVVLEDALLNYANKYNLTNSMNSFNHRETQYFAKAS